MARREKFDDFGVEHVSYVLLMGYPGGCVQWLWICGFEFVGEVRVGNMDVNIIGV